MGPKTSRARQLNQCRESKFTIYPPGSPTHATINAKRFVFSTLINGASYTTISDIFLWNDILIPSSATFYRIQPKIIAIIEQMAEESCRAHRIRMSENSVINMDGSWGHRRNSSQCILEFIDNRTKKIVDFSICMKNNHKMEGDYIGSSNGMEVECLKKLINNWKDDPNVVAYTHDNDGKTRALLREAGWNILEYLDTNHSLKSFPKKVKQFNKNHGNVLNGLQDKLACYIKYLAYLDISIDEKEKKWLNSANHYFGDHSNCDKHGPTREWGGKSREGAYDLLKEFLYKTIKSLRKSSTYVSTQLNESYHALKAKYSSKDICWIDSWVGRACAAILQWNEPNTWKFELYKRLNLPPLSYQSKAQLMRRHIGSAKKSICRSTKEYQLREAKRRREKKNQMASQTKGKDLYKSKADKKIRKKDNDGKIWKTSFIIQIEGFDRKDFIDGVYIGVEIIPPYLPDIEDFFFDEDEDIEFGPTRKCRKYDCLYFDY